MNLNDLAFKVAENEVGSVQVNIAQIKEIIKCVAIEIALNPRLADELNEKGMEYIKADNAGESIDD